MFQHKIYEVLTNTIISISRFTMLLYSIDTYHFYNALLYQKINQHNHSGLNQFENLTNSSHSHIFPWVRRGQLRTCALLSTTSNLQAGHLPCHCSCQVACMEIGLLIIPSWLLLWILCADARGNVNRERKESHRELVGLESWGKSFPRKLLPYGPERVKVNRGDCTSS